MRRAWDRPARRLIVAALSLVAAAWLIAHMLKGFSWAVFSTAVRATPLWAIAAAVALTPASYACLAVTEWFSLQSLGYRLSCRQAAKTAFAAYAVSNSLGFSAATGTAARLRLYGPMGLGPAAVTATAMVAGTAVSLSGVITAGLGLMLRPGTFALAFHWPVAAIIAAGLVLAAPAILWFVLLRGPSHEPRTPARSLGGRTLALAAGVADWALSGAALYVLLPHASLARFPEFLTVFVLGSLVSAATGAPGGLGVFEAVVLGLSTLMARAHETATALILYRAIYSLGPLALMSALLATRRLLKKRQS